MPAVKSDAKKSTKKLTEKQELFCLAYTGETKFNAVKAAEIAGYTGDYNSIAVTAHNLLKNPKIKSRIKELTAQRFRDAGYHVDRVIKEYIDIAFADLTDFYDEHGNLVIKKGEQPTAAIRGIKYRNGQVAEIQLHDKRDALERLSKLLDMASGKEYREHDVSKSFADFIRESFLNKEAGNGKHPG